MVQSACRAIPRWWKPLLIHDKLPLCKCKVKITHISSNPRFNSVVRCNLNRLQKQIFELKQCHQRTMEYWQRQKVLISKTKQNETLNIILEAIEQIRKL